MPRSSAHVESVETVTFQACHDPETDGFAAHAMDRLDWVGDILIQKSCIETCSRGRTGFRQPSRPRDMASRAMEKALVVAGSGAHLKYNAPAQGQVQVGRMRLAARVVAPMSVAKKVGDFHSRVV